MASSFIVWLFNSMAYLPLSVLHRLGAALGWASYLLSGSYAKRLRENLAHALAGRPATDFDRVLKATVAEAGKGMAELPWVWRRPVSEVIAKVRECHGWEHVTAAHAAGKGVIMLTPHMGCFEVIALYIATHLPITSMYSVPKRAWLDEVMRNGRQREQMRLARADVGGIRALYKALKRGELIGVLPDQVPGGGGEGEWANFFGRPAYTMTLIGRLQESSGATVLMCYAERLPRGQGFIIRIEPLVINAGIPLTAQINAALEKVILTSPAQYLWSYNRYKVPAGVAPRIEDPE